MRPKHSQMMTFSDDSRANVATVPAIVVSVVVVLAFGFNPLGEGTGTSELFGLTRELIGIFLIFWPLFSLTYLMWTHLGLGGAQRSPSSWSILGGLLRTVADGGWSISAWAARPPGR